MGTKLVIRTQPLHWQSLIFGHGWIFLEPFSPSPCGTKLMRKERLPSSVVTDIVYSHKDGEICGRVAASLDKADRAYLRAITNRMFCLEEDFSSFRQVCPTNTSLQHSGALLRSPTVFEDVVKTICTTNCSWGNTKSMVHHLCAIAEGTFPTPTEILDAGEEYLVRTARMGYRAAYIQGFAKRVHAGEINPETWPGRSFDPDVLREIKSIRGVGEYAQNHILFLIGNYTHLPIDCEVQNWVELNLFKGQKTDTSDIREYFAKYGQWAFLAYKFNRIAKRDNYIN